MKHTLLALLAAVSLSACTVVYDSEVHLHTNSNDTVTTEEFYTPSEPVVEVE